MTARLTTAVREREAKRLQELASPDFTIEAYR